MYIYTIIYINIYLVLVVESKYSYKWPCVVHVTIFRQLNGQSGWTKVELGQ